MFGGVTAGFGASFNAGQKVGKFGMFLLNNKNLVSATSVVLTSAIDITGEGVQDVSINQFGQRVITSLAVQQVSNVISKSFKPKNQIMLVTPDGVVLPKGATIPDSFVENPFRKGSYGIVENGKFVEKLRIDIGTSFNLKGPQERDHMQNLGDFKI